MTFLELITLCLALFVLVPHLLKNWGIRNILFPVYILLGIALVPILEGTARTVLMVVAQAGFVLLLFDVGVEIRLPSTRKFLVSFAIALGVYLFSIAVGTILARHCGLGAFDALIASAALGGVSLGLVYPPLKGDFHHNSDALNIFVSLELMTVAFFTLAGPLMDQTGIGWRLPAKLVGLLLLIYLISRLARHLTPTLTRWLDKTIYHRSHFVLFGIFLIAVIGDRLGLSAPKTAFFLGLFLAYATAFVQVAKEAITPIGERFLIPVFILSLGLGLDWSALSPVIFLQALGSAAVLFALRFWIFKRLLKVSPRIAIGSAANLTMVAIALELIHHRLGLPQVEAWVLLTGLFMTLGSLLSIPSRRSGLTSLPWGQNRSPSEDSRS